MRIEYHTPFGIYTTWHEAAERCERCDYDPCACIQIVRVYPGGKCEVVR